MEYCCDGFRNLISLAGERGVSFLVQGESQQEIGFLIQSRGVDYEDEEQIIRPKKFKQIECEFSINISSAIGMRFCPFCGQKLQDLIQKSPNLFLKLARDHQKYLKDYP